MTDPSRSRSGGPLAPYRECVWATLLAQGYAPGSALNLLRVMSHLSRWLSRRRLEARDLDAARIDDYLALRRRLGVAAWRTARGLEPLLAPLRRVGVVPPIDVARLAVTPASALVGAYVEHLADRGLRASTIAGYVRIAQEFLAGFTDSQRLELSSLATASITSFVIRAARQWTVARAKRSVSGLRPFLRYLHVAGWVERDLRAAALAVAGWRLAGIPKALASADLRRLLRGCDRRTRTGRRNYAVLLLLARLGLRAGDVAALSLDDVRWRDGILVVRGKGRHEDRLPLPHEVGDALASYLEKGRPRSDSRRVFLRVIAPLGALQSGAVSAIVRATAERVGLGSVSAHRLRHTAATQMLRHGASLTDIAQVLRHRSIDTTAIYAKVDHDRLRLVARAWPGRSR